MVTVLADKLWVCQDCLMVIANDDWTGLGCPTPDAFDARESQIRRGLDAFAGYRRYYPTATLNWVAGTGDADDHDEWSRFPCDCCQDNRHGARYAVTILKGE